MPNGEQVGVRSPDGGTAATSPGETMKSSAHAGQEVPAVLSTLEDGVLVVRMNRPQQLNALTPAMWELYAQTLQAAGENDQVAAIVVTGEGRGFCSGADATVLQSLAQEGGRRAESPYRHWLTTEIPKPVIAAINGACIGAGFCLALMCDLRFVAASARVGAGFPRLGLPAEHGSAWMLQRLGGYAAAFELLASGRLYAGAELLRLGFANAIVEEAAVLDHALAFTREMVAGSSPRALAMIKKQLQCGLHGSLREADELAARLASRAFASADFREALASRAERRKPSFSPLGKDWWP
jgi:enoyl-CoA hydratase/carnithine racemase